MPATSRDMSMTRTPSSGQAASGSKLFLGDAHRPFCYGFPAEGGVTVRRAAIGAAPILLRSISGIGRSSCPAPHWPARCSPGSYAAASCANWACRRWHAAQTLIRGRRALKRHDPRLTATKPRAAARCTRRRQTILRAPPPFRVRRDRCRIGATTSEEPGRIRRISDMRWRALKSAMPPAGEMGVTGKQ